MYVSDAGSSQGVWKLTNGTSTQLWSGQGARLIGGPAISSDGQNIAFSVRQNGRTLLFAMHADGTNTRIVTDSLDLQGAPAWAPDGQSITAAADDRGVPHLFRIPLDGRSPAPFVHDYSSRSRVGSRRPLRCLFRTRHRHRVFGESCYPRSHDTSSSSLRPHSGRSTHGLPAWRTRTRDPKRRDSA